VSSYKLAETWDRIAWAYWGKGERDRAQEIVREALAKYGSTVRGRRAQEHAGPLRAGRLILALLLVDAHEVVAAPRMQRS